MRHLVRRMRVEQHGFTLVELLIVLIILGILAAVAVPAYLSLTGKSKTTAAESNVRAAIPAAESWYLDKANNPSAPSYTGITGAHLSTEAPGVSPNVKALVLHGGEGFCVEDDEPSGAVYSYIGGDPGSSVASGYSVGTLEPVDCATSTGVTGAA